MRRGVLLLLLASLALAGCGSDDVTGPKPTASNVLRYDLTTPTTKERLGYAQGRNDFAIDRGSGPMFDVTVLLPDGHTLHTPAFAVNSLVSGLGDEPTSLEVVTRGTPDAARAALRSAADDLGLPAAEVARGDAFIGQPAALGSATTSLQAPALGYITAPSITLGIDDTPDEVTVAYQLFWG